jgi:dTDP-4-amino-4,6-dideoxygalactose transaminase
MQPVFWPIPRERKTINKKGHYPCRVVEGKVSEKIFEQGLCLPSGTAMTDKELEKVVKIIKEMRG